MPAAARFSRVAPAHHVLGSMSGHAQRNAKLWMISGMEWAKNKPCDQEQVNLLER